MSSVTGRGIEWSLRAFAGMRAIVSMRAFASMRTVCLSLRARAVAKFFLRAANTLENTDGEQRAL